MRFQKYILGCVVALGLSLAPLTSIAATISLGTLSPGSALNFGNTVTEDPFTDFFTFDLDANSNTLVENELLFRISSANFKGELFEGTPTTPGSFLGEFIGNDSLAVVLSAVSPYFLKITGNLQPGKDFGVYAGSISATAVPIPAASVLFGSALLAFAGFATRRRVS